MRQYSIKHGVRIDEVDPETYDTLLNYPWPGNVRELEHVSQRAVIFCRNGRLLKRDLPQHILSGNAGPTNDPTVILSKTQTSAKHDGTQDVLSLESRIALSEKEIIEQSLFKNSFRRTKTAQELGISRVTLYNKMRKYGLQR